MKIWQAMCYLWVLGVLVNGGMAALSRRDWFEAAAYLSAALASQTAMLTLVKATLESK